MIEPLTSRSFESWLDEGSALAKHFSSLHSLRQRIRLYSPARICCWRPGGRKYLWNNANWELRGLYWRRLKWTILRTFRVRITLLSRAATRSRFISRKGSRESVFSTCFIMYFSKINYVNMRISGRFSVEIFTRYQKFSSLISLPSNEKIPFIY